MNFQYPNFGTGPSRDRLRFRGDRFDPGDPEAAMAHPKAYGPPAVDVSRSHAPYSPSGPVSNDHTAPSSKMCKKPSAIATPATTKLYDRRGYNPEKAASFFAIY
jgi:hypothetical protein